MTEITSKKDNFSTTYKYSDDLKSLTMPNVYNSMNDRNILNPVVETIIDKNGEFLSLEKVNYDYWKNNSWGDNSADLILPKLIETKFGTGLKEPRVAFKYYDNIGNVLEQSFVGGMNLSYLWGYNGQYPIVEAKNAKHKNIFYEGFEDAGQNTVFNDAKTGYYSHSGSYLKQLSGLDNGQYILSYWLKGSNWLMQNAIVDVNNGSYTINISGQIDDIRFCPVNTQLTTYTYKPLIGMTSATDAKGMTTYYEYDAFQRLKNIKDQDGHVIKSYDYHYKTN